VRAWPGLGSKAATQENAQPNPWLGVDSDEDLDGMQLEEHAEEQGVESQLDGSQVVPSFHSAWLPSFISYQPRPYFRVCDRRELLCRPMSHVS
jgi:hypothetical protein